MIPISRCALLALLAAVAACDGGGGGTEPEPQPAPLVLQLASGSGQPGLPGEPLPQPLVVRVTRGGQPAQNVIVSFGATDGEVSVPTRTTNEAGETGVVWTLPADSTRIAAGRVTARLATAPAADSVVFTARTFRRDEMDLLVSEDGVPVSALVYDAAGFLLTGYQRRDFSDSAVLVLRKPTAPHDVAAFTPGRAPLLLAPAWSAGRDTVRLRFSTEVIRMPMTIWVVQPPFDSTVQLVGRHLQGVVESWEAQAGIGLRDVRIVDATGFPRAGPYQDTIQGTGCMAGIHTDIGRDAGRLNAYYVGQPSLGSAAYCGEGSMMVFPLAWQRSDYLLAHEIGHGFLGGHHETLPDNIMHFRGEGTRFSPGQMFRAHYSATSILNTMFNAYPESRRRPCATDPTSGLPICPPTNFVLD